ncbi:MAG: hypothetical protein O2818_00760 [Bacteroidetes bacterium]|nr:hypothetical protein [Bacteroidota bacterium]MDA1335393.1 hypothetical protein [Bacteroidota bacterium]
MCNQRILNPYRAGESFMRLSNEGCLYHDLLFRQHEQVAQAVERNKLLIWHEWKRTGFKFPHEFESNGLNLSWYLEGHLQCEKQPCFGCYLGEWTLIWKHAIQCNLGSCYNTLFETFILPEFNAPMLLDAILRGEVILDRPNVIRGRTGARAYRSLLERIQECAYETIKLYVVQEFFPHWFEKADLTPLLGPHYSNPTK